MDETRRPALPWSGGCQCGAVRYEVRAEPMTLSRGRKLYREDDDADCAYVVLSGSFLLYRETPDGPVSVGTAGPGAMMGELALVADTRRLTSAMAETESRIIRLSRKMFRRILEEYPETAAALHRHMVENFKKMVAQIERVGGRFLD